MTQLQTDSLAVLIIFAAHVLSGMTGFGSGVFGLPLLALVLGLDLSKTAMLLLSTGFYSYMAVRSYRDVAWRELAIIVILAGIGIPVGMALYEFFPRHAAMIILGAVVMVFGIQGMLKESMTRIPRPIAQFLVFAGGIVHGAFTTGGPLIVVYASETIRDKTVFRATLSVMWVIFSAVLMIGWTIRGSWPRGTIHATLLGAPALVAALYVGDWLHEKMTSRVFHRVVHMLLIFTGALLILLP